MIKTVFVLNHGNLQTSSLDGIAIQELVDAGMIKYLRTTHVPGGYGFTTFTHFYEVV